jgi:hypothetical protein
MTEHPCAGMSKAEISAFEAFAINRLPRCSKKTIEELLARGVIATGEKKLDFHDGLPPSVVPDYYVPLPVHMQWCAWASERYRGKI